MTTIRHFWTHLTQFFLKCEMFQTNVLEEIKTHILCSVTFFVFENRAVYEIMWQNIVEWGSPQMAIWRLRIARWITEANTHSQSVILTAVPLQQWLQGYYYVIRALPVLLNILLLRVRLLRTVHSVMLVSLLPHTFLWSRLSHSVEQRPSSELNIRCDNQEIHSVFTAQLSLTAFLTARHWPFSWTRWIHSTFFHPITLRSILIISSYLRFGLQGASFASGLWGRNFTWI